MNKSTKNIRIKMDTGEDSRQLVNILMHNGYKCWFDKNCTVDMGGMAGSQYEYFICAELIN